MVTDPDATERAGGTGEPNAARLRTVLWNLRGMALLALGPGAGILLAAEIFGLPRNLEYAAAGMFAFSLCLCLILARAEWRALSRDGSGRA